MAMMTYVVNLSSCTILHTSPSPSPSPSTPLVHSHTFALSFSLSLESSVYMCMHLCGHWLTHHLIYSLAPEPDGLDFKKYGFRSQRPPGGSPSGNEFKNKRGIHKELQQREKKNLSWPAANPGCLRCAAEHACDDDVDPSSIFSIHAQLRFPGFLPPLDYFLSLFFSLVICFRVGVKTSRCSANKTTTTKRQRRGCEI